MAIRSPQELLDEEVLKRKYKECAIRKDFVKFMEEKLNVVCTYTLKDINGYFSDFKDILTPILNAAGWKIEWRARRVGIEIDPDGYYMIVSPDYERMKK